ncbi:MAG: hypothetical protein J5546_04910 [Lachnospiraceae bacterium]|nr:hypothetical protein [Lachnospiraceae bacterium]
MTTARIVNAIGFLDEDLIAEAAVREKKSARGAFLKWGSIAAGFVIVVTACAMLLPGVLHRDKYPNSVDPRYKNDGFFYEATAILWPWEYRTIYEQYRNLNVNGISYDGMASKVSEDLVGERIGSFTVTGQEEISQETYSTQAEVYELKDVSRDWYLAVKLDGDYYVFKSVQQNMPAKTVGELLDQVDLPKVVTLGRYAKRQGNQITGYYELRDDAYVWEVLSECRDAKIIDGTLWEDQASERLEFSVTSQPLGVYRVSMYVTEDGFVWTNAFRYATILCIGKEAAGKILKYAKENSDPTEAKPYRYSAYGVVTEITEDYVLIDDSSLCKDPSKGITYKVLLNDLRISRCFTTGHLKLGDLIAVSYDGDKVEGTQPVIDAAISANRVGLAMEQKE